MEVNGFLNKLAKSSIWSSQKDDKTNSFFLKFYIYLEIHKQ